MTVSEALRAAGDTTWCMAARIFLAWFVFTPASWAMVFVFGGGPSEIVVSLVVYTAILAVTFVWRFMSGRWRDIELVQASG
jgi:MATE family multidrug resistance protein